VLLAATTVAGAADRSEPLPWDLDVRVVFDARSGPESLRADLERALATELRRDNFFRSVAVAAGREDRAADLLLTLVLEDVEDEQVHDTSIAQHHAPGSLPDVARGYVARLAAKVRLSLDTVPDGGTVRFKRFARAGEHRPILNEDARLEAVRKFTDGVARTARGLACRGSTKKWQRDVAEARERAASSR